MKFQVHPLGEAFEIPNICKKNGISGISKCRLRPFRWLEFGILIKETKHFKCREKTSHHVQKKKTQYNKFLSGILANNRPLIWARNLAMVVHTEPITLNPYDPNVTTIESWPCESHSLLHKSYSISPIAIKWVGPYPKIGAQLFHISELLGVLTRICKTMVKIKETRWIVKNNH